jgi:Holliday junction resolvase RusA-like endonuclease
VIVQTFSLPMGPSVNAMYGNRSGGGRGRFIMPAYRAWKRRAGYELDLARIAPVTGPWRLAVDLPAAARGDADNYVKALADLLVAHRITPDDRHMELDGVTKRGNRPGFVRLTLTGVPA